jgi:hypothetical protein
MIEFEHEIERQKIIAIFLYKLEIISVVQANGLGGWQS